MLNVVEILKSRKSGSQDGMTLCSKSLCVVHGLPYWAQSIGCFRKCCVGFTCVVEIKSSVCSAQLCCFFVLSSCTGRLFFLTFCSIFFLSVPFSFNFPIPYPNPKKRNDPSVEINLSVLLSAKYDCFDVFTCVHFCPFLPILTITHIPNVPINQTEILFQCGVICHYFSPDN